MTDPRVDIQALADLARVEISQEEAKKLEREIPDILRFVSQIQSIAAHVENAAPTLSNVMRDDTGAHESGRYTKTLLEGAPAQKEGRIVVAQVIKKRS